MPIIIEHKGNCYIQLTIQTEFIVKYNLQPVLKDSWIDLKGEGTFPYIFTFPVGTEQYSKEYLVAIFEKFKTF